MTPATTARKPTAQLLDERAEKLEAIRRKLESVGGDITEPEAEAELDAMLTDADQPVNERFEGYRYVYKLLEKSAEFRRQEAQVRLDAARRDEANMDRMKARLRYYFEAHGLERIDLPSGGRVSLVANGGKAPVVLKAPVEQLPGWAQRLTIAANLEGIRNVLESGDLLDFAELGDRGKSLRIR